MDLEISAKGYKPLQLTHEIPLGLEQYYIPGTKTFSCIAPFGIFMIQLMELNASRCLYIAFSLEEDASFIINVQSLFIISAIVLKGNFKYELKPFHHLYIYKNQFNIFYCNYPNITLSLKKGRHMSVITFHPPKYFISAIDFFPAFEGFGKNIKENQTSVINAFAFNVTPGMLDAIYRLTHAPYSPYLLNFHLTIVKELLHKMLQQAFRPGAYNKKFSLDDLEKIYAAKEFIEANLPHHFSITRVSAHVGLNEQKLKEGFKEIFQKGLFEYFRDRIMEIAQKEIEQTRRSIKQIAFRAGYKKANNFSAAFKKKFGRSPLSWRKEFKENEME